MSIGRHLVSCFVVLAAPLALTGCWTGNGWFQPAEGVAAIPSGSYRLATAGDAMDSGERLTFIWLGGDRQTGAGYRVDGPERPLRVILVPLAPDRPGRFIVQAQPADRPLEADATFMMLVVDGNRRRLLILPCGAAAREAVERSGGSISRDPQTGASCIFADRRTMEATMRAVPEDEIAEPLELVPDQN